MIKGNTFNCWDWEQDKIHPYNIRSDQIETHI